MTPPAAPFVELDALFEKATKGRYAVHNLHRPEFAGQKGCLMSYILGPYDDSKACVSLGSDNEADHHFIAALVNAYPALKAAHAAAATAARNDALEEAARVLDTTFPDDWSEWAAAKIRALAAQGKG